MYWTQAGPEPALPPRATRCLITAEAIKAAGGYVQSECRHFHNAIHMFVRSAAARDAEVSVQGWAGGGGVRRWEGCMGSACAFHPRRRWKPICSPDHNAGPEESRSAPPPTVGMWFPPHTHSHTGTEVLWNQSVGLFSCPVCIHLGTKCHVYSRLCVHVICYWDLLLTGRTCWTRLHTFKCSCCCSNAKVHFSCRPLTPVETLVTKMNSYQFGLEWIWMLSAVS